MPKFVSTSPDNIRLDGTGRLYVAEPGTNIWDDIGEIDSFTMNNSVETSEIKSTRTAAKATLIKSEKSRSAGLSFGMREHTAVNLAMAMMGSSWSDNNQAAGYQDLTSLGTLTKDKFVELGKYDVYITKIVHGTVTGGPFTVGDTITINAVTAKVVFVGSGFIEVINPSGVLVAGSMSSGAKTATATSVITSEDVCVVNSATPTIRYTQGVDYTLDADYGMIRILSDGAIATTCFTAFSCKATTAKYNWMLSGSSALKKLRFVADADDQGPREVLTINRVQLSMDGDMTLLGEGESVIKMAGTILADTTQPSGQEYYKLELIA